MNLDIATVYALDATRWSNGTMPWTKLTGQGFQRLSTRFYLVVPRSRIRVIRKPRPPKAPILKPVRVRPPSTSEIIRQRREEYRQQLASWGY